MRPCFCRFLCFLRRPRFPTFRCILSVLFDKAERLVRLAISSIASERVKSSMKVTLGEVLRAKADLDETAVVKGDFFESEEDVGNRQV